ncbi:hypothetical protein C100_05455 [Sphingobium sp. C100]|uniref:hypothetical protein n=1 Tax=Sphingobium sp. C100 TaxID=1207055 RepID=UPI0003D66F49|nr:hypothetical protein [Sphingobium sp. C100]ETI64800.1 hypothetical protein C100_05455 [Sphingobium sp. C100]
MQHSTQFSVRYLTEEPVHIRDIISSLQAVEATLNETARLLPALVDGLSVQKLEVKVREIAQASPLREAFAVALFVAFQKQLESEVPDLITDATGMIIPDRFDTVVTVVALIVVFYGADALKSLVFGTGSSGAAKAQLDSLIAELAPQVGKSEDSIRKILADRYSEKTLWRRVMNLASRFFAPSKQQDSAPLEVNGRMIPQDIVRDIPAEFLFDDASEERPSRSFNGVHIELHAQDRDNAGRGWAAVIDSVSGQRLRMKLMDEVSATDLWNRDHVNGDISVIYENVAGQMVPKEVHLHRVTGAAE